MKITWISCFLLALYAYSSNGDVVRRRSSIVSHPRDSILLPMPMPSWMHIRRSSHKQDRCLMEKKIGPCRAGFRRIFFNTKTKKCEPFLFGGCQGNGNNFVSSSECEDMCKKHMPGASNRVRARFGLPSRPVNEKCTLAMDVGTCRALKPRYYYNPASRRCEEFLYGGCGGNANNFETLQACVSECGKQLRRRAELPPPPPKCSFGNNTYAVGDIVRLGDDPCKACVCSSPPDLTCSIKKCPHIVAVSSECTEIKDDFGCCTESFQCPGDSNSGGLAGGFPIVGGFSSSPVDGDAKKVAAVAARQLLTGVTAVTGALCKEATLLEIIDLKTQMVAGTNYEFTLRLRAKTGPKCQETMDRFCRKITVYKPLPFACQDLETCLQLIYPDEIECFDNRAQLN